MIEYERIVKCFDSFLTNRCVGSIRFDVLLLYARIYSMIANFDNIQYLLVQLRIENNIIGNFNIYSNLWKFTYTFY